MNKHFKVDGIKILNPDGNEFLIKGVNINGPGWCFPRDTLQDVELIIDVWKFNTVRLCAAIGWEWAKNFNKDLDPIIDAFTKRNIVVILEVHDYTGIYPPEKEYRDEHTYSKHNKYIPSMSEFKEWWIDKANRFKDNPYVWFNIMNEPGADIDKKSADLWLESHTELIETIKSTGAENPIVIDEHAWGQGNGYLGGSSSYDSAIIRMGGELNKKYKNLIFSLHVYDTWKDGESRFNQYFSDAHKLGLCVILGEFGIVRNNKTQASAVMAMYNSAIPKNIGRMYWAWDDTALPMTTANCGWRIDRTDGEKPGNLTWVGELVWLDNRGLLTAPVKNYMESIMTYQNPVVRGYNPDPSVCKANGKYYLITSSFQFFPGVPLFESDDLINWKQIGYCLTRESQVPLDNVGSSGGIYAATIRFNEGRFYMVTTNVGHKTHAGNFYVWTDNIYGEWSEPIYVDQGGIDPSLYFENGVTYFTSNGSDENGKSAILQCEIDITTGKKLTESKVIWHGTGGRYLEAPHVYKIGKYYYMMAAEGGTEYGHMIVYARGDSVWGPFTHYPNNPVLTNRNLGGYQLQGIGHGDLIEDDNGNWWMYALAFRQIHQWMTYHHLGRETCLLPVTFNNNGWFTVEDGTAQLTIETDRIPPSVKQVFQTNFTFANTSWDKDWQFLRLRHKDNYILNKDCVKIKGAKDTLDTAGGGTPALIALHQKEFDMELKVQVKTIDGEAGITMYMDESHHYDLALVKNNDSYKVMLKLNIGDIKFEKAAIAVSQSSVKFIVRSDSINYNFYYLDGEKEIHLGSGQTRYLSSEVAGGFTGVILGLYSQNGNEFNEFTDFECTYSY